MRRYLVPLALALSLNFAAPAMAEEDDFPLPQSVNKCYESAEADSEVVECTHLEANHWEQQVSIHIRKAEQKCNELSSIYTFDPNYGMTCRQRLHQGYQAWFNYREAMMAAMCGDKDDSFLSYECAAMRSRLTREYLDIIYAFYRLYPNN